MLSQLVPQELWRVNFHQREAAFMPPYLPAIGCGPLRVGGCRIMSVGMGSHQAKALVKKTGGSTESLAASSLCSWGMGAPAGTGDMGGALTGPTLSSVSCSCQFVIRDLLKELICFQILKT